MMPEFAMRAGKVLGTPVAREPKPVANPIRPVSGLRMARPMSFKKGGKVKKGGLAKVHKGERIVKAKDVLSKKPKTPRAKAKVKKTMDEWKSGTLHSGSKQGPVVKNQKQAVAIALSQARKEK